MTADGARTWILTGSSEHWKLAFQAQLRTVSGTGAALPMDRMQAAAGISA